MKIFPKKSQSKSEILSQLKNLKTQDASWREGKTWSLVYHAGQEHTDFIKEVYALFFHENALNPNAFPSLAKMEIEVLTASADLLGGGAQTAGTMTSGGSESILMALKTYRDRFAYLNPESKSFELVLPQSVHPAFLKACHYLGIKPVMAGLNDQYSVNLKEVEDKITAHTIALVGSAPAYPHGVMDSIVGLSEIALKRQLPLHVDACLGGFFLPFLKKSGLKEVPDFDFRVPGVTSISADLHKYGFAAKGASVILYRNADLRRFQFFVYSDWPGGLFASPSMTGTRPGGSIAAAWATLQAIGEEGYLDSTRRIMATTDLLRKGIEATGHFRVLGNPIMGVMAFAPIGVDAFAIADRMQEKGWYLDRQQLPTALHLMVTLAHESIVSTFLTDLVEAIEKVKAHPELAQQGSAALYGMAAQIPDRSQVQNALYHFLDQRYAP